MKLQVMTAIIVERVPTDDRRTELWKAYLKGETDMNAVWVGKTRNEAIGLLVVHLAPSLNLRITQKG